MDATDDLFTAIARGDRDLVARMVEARPELGRASNADTLPAIVFARAMGQRAILRLLADAGPPLDVCQASMIDDVDRLRDGLDFDPASVGAYDAAGFTALHYAAYYGAPNAVRLLLERGAHIEAVTRNFLSNMPLHAAAAGGHRDVCALLLDRGADANARQHHDFVPLHTAAFRDDMTMADLLLSHGAVAGAVNDEGKSPADFAREQGHTVLAAYLRARASTA